MVRVYIFQIWTLLVKISLGSIRFEHSLAYYTTPSVIVSPTKPSQKIKFLFLLDPPGTFTTICKRKYIYLLMNKLLVEITHPNQMVGTKLIATKMLGPNWLWPQNIKTKIMFSHFFFYRHTIEFRHIVSTLWW